MLVTIEAIYENGVLAPVAALPLDEQQRVMITVHAEAPPLPNRPLMPLAEIADLFPDNPDSPPDLAAQHDHYLYGLLRRDPP